MKVSRQLEASPTSSLRWAKTFAIVNLSRDEEKQKVLIIKQKKREIKTMKKVNLNNKEENNKKENIMTISRKTENEYVKALDERIKIAKTKNVSAANEKKMQNMKHMLSSERLCTLLRNAKVNSSAFLRAIYASEKVVKFATQAIAFDATKLNENTHAIFKTAINCAKNNVEFTKDDACASISKDLKIDENKKAYIFRRNIIQQVSTIAAQSQTSLDALKTLNIISENAKKKNVFDVNLDSDLTKALCKNFEIDLNAIAEAA